MSEHHQQQQHEQLDNNSSLFYSDNHHQLINHNNNISNNNNTNNNITNITNNNNKSSICEIITFYFNENSTNSISYPITKSNITNYYYLNSLQLIDCIDNELLFNLIENNQIIIKLFIKLLNQNEFHNKDNYLIFYLNHNLQFMIQQYFNHNIELILNLNFINQNLEFNLKNIKLFSNIITFKNKIINNNNLLLQDENNLNENINNLNLNNLNNNQLLNNNSNISSSNSSINIDKYIKQRYKLFSKYDNGIKIDTTSWYEVTPENIAIYIAKKINSISKNIILIDGFTGCGGNMIHFLLQPNIELVIGCDISKIKLDYTINNISIYGCDKNKMKLVEGDYMYHVQNNTFNNIINEFKNNNPNKEYTIITFLAPPYGTFNYLNCIYNLKYDLLINNNQHNGIDIYKFTRKYFCKNIIYLLPKNVNINQVSYQFNENDEEDEMDFEFIYMDEKYLKLILMYSNECLNLFN